VDYTVDVLRYHSNCRLSFEGFIHYFCLHYRLVMCSCSTKGRVSLVIGKQRQRERQRRQRLQKRRWAEEEAGAEVARDRGGRGANVV